MHGTSDIFPLRWAVTSVSRRKGCMLGRQSPTPEERASIPDNWLCISDWQITHQLVFGQREESEQGERHVAGSHIPFLLEKYKALWPHVRCQRKPLFILKHKQTLTQVSTYTHIHGGCKQSIIVPDSRLFWLQSLRGKASTQVTHTRYMFLSKRLYFQLTIHLFLITDLFFCHAGSNADEPT